MEKTLFSRDRLERIIDNTNRHLSKFSVYLIKDHQMNYDNIVGKVASPLEGKIITEENLPEEYKNNEEARKMLLGRYAVFSNAIEILKPEYLHQIKDAGGISVGLCVDSPDDEKIVEVSLTPLPAIPLMTLFQNKNITSWNDYDQEKPSLEEFETAYNELSSALLSMILECYNNKNKVAVNMNDIDRKLLELLNGFAIRVMKSYKKILYGVDAGEGTIIQSSPLVGNKGQVFERDEKLNNYYLAETHPLQRQIYKAKLAKKLNL